MSKTYRYDTAGEVNRDLRRCKGGVHEAKVGKYVKRAKAKAHFTREVRQSAHHGG